MSKPIESFEQHNPLRENARRLAGCTLRGKPCSLLDNSGDALPESELALILDSLIQQDKFGFKPRSNLGASAINLERREASHIQIGEKLYRLIIFRFEARIEPF